MRKGVGEQNTELSLSMFLKDMSKIQLLKPEEEKELFSSFHNDGDIEARNKIITAYLPLAAKHAWTASLLTGHPFLDLIQEASKGLIRATEKYDPNKGTTFATFALIWINANVNNYVKDNMFLFNIVTTQNYRKLYKYKRELMRVQETEEYENKITDLSEKLNISREEIIDFVCRLNSKLIYYEEIKPTESIKGEGNHLGTFKRKENFFAVPATQEDGLLFSDYKKVTNKLLKVLDPRERDIIKKRYLNSSFTTLDEIGKDYNITRERVRQLETRAIKKMKASINKEKLSLFS